MKSIHGYLKKYVANGHAQACGICPRTHKTQANLVCTFVSSNYGTILSYKAKKAATVIKFTKNPLGVLHLKEGVKTKTKITDCHCSRKCH